jgi:DNA-binding CsgD family transcriptional regulator
MRSSTADARRVGEVEAALRTIVDGGPSALSWLPEALRTTLDSEKAFSCTYTQRARGLGLDGFVDRISPRLVTFTDGWLADKVVGWSAFNPMRPEPAQRNIPLTLAEISALTGVDDVRATPVVREVYSRFGLANDHHLRVLVCEGASLLGYLSICQSGAIAQRQRDLFSRLVAPIRRRLSIERLLEGRDRGRTTLDAALEEIPSAAFVVGALGRVLHSNSLGRAWLADGKHLHVRALRDAVRAGNRAGEFRITPVLSGAGSRRYLVVRRTDDPLKRASRQAAARWRLSAREGQVLALLTEGLTNRAIAAQLGISPRTVEFHLRVMFEKAQVETRAELLVQAMRP